MTLPFEGGFGTLAGGRLFGALAGLDSLIGALTPLTLGRPAAAALGMLSALTLTLPAAAPNGLGVTGGNVLGVTAGNDLGADGFGSPFTDGAGLPPPTLGLEAAEMGFLTLDRPGGAGSAFCLLLPAGGRAFCAEEGGAGKAFCFADAGAGSAFLTAVVLAPFLTEPVTAFGAVAATARSP